MGLFKSPTSNELAFHGVDTSSWDNGDGRFILQSPRITLENLEKYNITVPDIEIPEIKEVTGRETNLIQKKNSLVPVVSDMIIKEPANENKIPRNDVLKNITETGHGNKSSSKSKKGDTKPAPTGKKWDGCKLDTRCKDIVWLDAAPNARKDFFTWYNTFVLNDDNYGENYIRLGKIHEEWATRIEHGKKIGMLCPRDHYKTSLLNVGYILYHICEKQELISNKGILNISWDKDLAEETYFAIKQNLSENRVILSYYGYLIDEERPLTQKKMYFTFQPSGSRPGLFCAPFKSGRITGTHPYIAFLDDIEDTELSPGLMIKFRKIIDKKLIPAVGKHGRIIITGTLKGWNTKNDAYLWLQTKPTFEMYRYPAVEKMPPMSDVKYVERIVPLLNEKGKPMLNINGETLMRKEFEVVSIVNDHEYTPIYDERYNIFDLVEKKLELRDEEGSDDTFNSEYLLKPSDPSGRYFKYKRLADFKQSGYTPMGFVEHTNKHHKHRYLWIDPGGEGDQAHGIAVAVMGYLDQKYYLLDVRVIKKPIPEAARIIGDMIIQWKVNKWGCEGNFSQKATYGREIKEKVRLHLESKNMGHLYTTPYIRQNTGEKLKRISTHMSTMLGAEDMPVQMYVNKDSPGYNDFLDQYGYFGKKITSANKHDFDVLDCKASIKIHLLGTSRPYACRAV